MRWIVLIILALIVLLAGYTVWPIYDLYRIASAVETRNLVALQELVDFPSLRVSLIKQIRDAYRKQTDKSASSERSVGAAVGWAQMSDLGRLVDLLGKGIGICRSIVAVESCGTFCSEQFRQPMANLA
jgi:hypothetical protein